MQARPDMHKAMESNTNISSNIKLAIEEDKGNDHTLITLEDNS